MIGLLEEIRQPRQRAIGRRRRESGICAREINVLGIRALRVSLLRPENIKAGELERRICLMKQALKERRISRICFSGGFQHGAWFLRESFVEMGSRFLYEKMAGSMAAAIARSGGQTGFFYAKSVSEKEESLLISMCRHYRYVMLDVERGGELVCENIRRRLGISIVEKPTPRQLLDSDGAFFFSGPEKRMVLPKTCIAVGVDEACLKNVAYERYVAAVRLALSDRVKAGLPAGFPPEPLVSAALENGYISPGEIRIQALRVGRGKAGFLPPFQVGY